MLMPRATLASDGRRLARMATTVRAQDEVDRAVHEYGGATVH